MRVVTVGRVAATLCVCAGIASCGGSSGSDMTGAGTPLIQMTSNVSGDGQSGTVATALANPLRVQVTLNGSPLAGDSVTWSAAASGAALNPAKSATDANGIAAAIWTLGHTAGAQTATASLSGATGSPVTFTASATAGPAASLASAGGNNQKGATGSALSTPLSVLATDAFSNPVAGVGVGWV